MSDGLVHFASNDIEVCGHVRQRCVWCGALLIDHDLARVAIAGQPGDEPATWLAGGLVLVDGHFSMAVEPEERTDGRLGLPEGLTTCHDIDPEITAE